MGQTERQCGKDQRSQIEAYRYFCSRLTGKLDLRDWDNLNPGPGQPNKSDFGYFFRKVQSGSIEYSKKLRAWGSGSAESVERLVPKGRPPKSSEVGQFLYQLSIMLNCGITVVHSLDSLREQIDSGYFAQVLTQMGEDTSKGWTLSASMKTFPRIFSSEIVALVRASESTGNLSQGLQRGAELLERQSKFNKKLGSALASPLMILLFGGLIIWAIVHFVIPKFLEVYNQLNVELPALSKLVIGGVNAVNTPWVPLLFFGFLFVLYRFRSTIKQNLLELGLRLPMLGRWIRVAVAKQTCDILADLTTAGVPIHKSFTIVAECTDFDLHRKQMLAAVDTLRETGSLSETLSSVQTLPSVMARMASAGEESGELENLLRSLSRVLGEQIESSIDQFLALVEPLSMAFLGIGVAVLFIGLFLPIYEVIAQI